MKTWWLVGENKFGSYATNLHTTDKDEAFKYASHHWDKYITMKEKEKYFVFAIWFADEDEDGYMDFETVTDTVSIKDLWNKIQYRVLSPYLDIEILCDETYQAKRVIAFYEAEDKDNDCYEPYCYDYFPTNALRIALGEDTYTNTYDEYVALFAADSRYGKILRGEAT